MPRRSDSGWCRTTSWKKPITANTGTRSRPALLRRRNATVFAVRQNVRVDELPLRAIGTRMNRSGEGVRLLELRAIKLLRRYAANSRSTLSLRINRSLPPLARSKLGSIN